MRVRNIAQKYNLNESKVREFLKSKNYQTNKLFISEENKNKIISLYLDGDTIKSISDNFNLDIRHIRNILNENNIKIRKTNTKY